MVHRRGVWVLEEAPSLPSGPYKTYIVLAYQQFGTPFFVLQENVVFVRGVKAMLPITTGVIPFGLVMGTVTANADLSLLQSFGMNFFVFAGASQLAAVDLMTQQVSILVVVATAFIINLRMMLYSAALSGLVKNQNLMVKALLSYAITDQTYAVLVANQEHLKSDRDKIVFYAGAALCMITAWQIAVVAGFVFGNFAPSSLALDYAVPLSFMALTLPALKNKTYYAVAITSAVLSVVLKELPFNTGLLLSGAIAICLGGFLTRTRNNANR